MSIIISEYKLRPKQGEEITRILHENKIILQEVSHIVVQSPTVFRLLYKVDIHQLQLRYCQHFCIFFLDCIEGKHIIWSSYTQYTSNIPRYVKY